MKLFRNTYNLTSTIETNKLSLYLVTDREKYSTLDEFKKAITLAVKGGVTAVQLREKDPDFSRYCEVAAFIKPVLDENNIPLIINDNPEVAKAVGTPWIHLGQKDCTVSDARRIIGDGAIIGLSVETEEQAYNALNQSLNYIAISPILASKSRPDLTNPWGLEKAKRFCSQTSVPIVAIGGINKNNVHQVLDCGVSGICVISAILHQPCPQKAARELKAIIDQHEGKRSRCQI